MSNTNGDYISREANGDDYVRRADIIEKFMDRLPSISVNYLCKIADEVPSADVLTAKEKAELIKLLNIHVKPIAKIVIDENGYSLWSRIEFCLNASINKESAKKVECPWRGMRPEKEDSDV